MSLSTAVTELFGIESPIVSAPMDAVAGGGLAAAVSRAGGLGLIGGGYGDQDWLEHQFTLASGERVGCGFITWSLDRQHDLLDLALDHRPVAVMLSFGDPAPFAERIQQAGARLICQVQDRAQADHALRLGADMLVAQGSEAGGHGHGARSTMTLVPELADLAAAHRGGVPVIAAGGIADGRGLAASLALGAAGVLVGTRFYAAAEALSTPQAREEIAASSGDATCRTSIYDLLRGHPWPAGHTMNVLANTLTECWHGSETTLVEQLTTVAAQYRQAVAEHDYTIANVTAGQAVGLVSRTVPAGDIVTSMSEQAEAALASRSQPDRS
jgi:nitronate monooxygenase